MPGRDDARVGFQGGMMAGRAWALSGREPREGADGCGWKWGRRDAAAPASFIGSTGCPSTAALGRGDAASYGLADSFWHLLVPCDTEIIIRSENSLNPSST